MTVAITSNLNLIDAANALTGWSSSVSDATASGFSREGGTNLALQGNNNTVYGWHTDTGLNSYATGRTLFGWMIAAAPNTQANTGFGLILGDGTNMVAYSVGGNDNFGFFVNGWGGFRLDSANLPTTKVQLTGSVDPTLSAIEDVGYYFDYTTQAVGLAKNCFYDVIRDIANGSAALTIGGGTTGARGTFSEVTADDESTASGKAYGIFRRLAPGSSAYEMTFGVEFGGSGATDSYFEDSGFQLIIQGTGMTAGNMDVDLILGTATNRHFDLSDGVVVGVGTVSNWNLSAAFSHMKLTRMTFTDLGTISLPAAGTNRAVVDCIFNNCGQISLGDALVFTGVTFNGTTNANGALLLNSTSDENAMSGLTFNSDGTGHAIEISTAGTYDFTNFNFSGYATSNGTTGNEVIKNTSGGAVTINVSGGSGTVSYETSGGSVTINNSVSFNLTNLVAGTTIYAEATAGGSLSVGTVMISAQVIPGTTFSTNLVANQPFKCLLAKHDDEGGATDYEPILFEDTTGSGFSRRIEQIAYP